MSPSVTEIVFAMGQGGRVVGISQYTTYPPEALKKPECGGFVNPNFERILELQPDLVINQGIAEKTNVFCQDRGIPFTSVELTDLESVFAAIRQVGHALAREEDADVLCARMRLRLADVAARVKGRPRPRVLLLVGRDSGSLRDLTVAGGGTFLHDVLQIAGGDNVFADVKDYPAVSKESLLLRQPDVVLELRGEGMMGKEQLAEIVSIWNSMPTLSAVKNGKICAIGETYALIPGPRLVELADRIAEVLQGPGGE
jgi:iron complex transport system substrate-binding protein